jgi:hypothetical protein
MRKLGAIFVFAAESWLLSCGLWACASASSLTPPTPSSTPSHETQADSAAKREFDEFAHTEPPKAQSSKTTPPQAGSLSFANRPLPPSIDELEREELSRPADPQVKFSLGWRHWCEKHRGVAFEHWLWLEQFEPKSNEAHEALKLMALARKDPQPLNTLMRCKEFTAHP